jgi:hypothetical protein
MSNSSTLFDWAREIDGGVTVCDRHGVILYMNDKAGNIFAKWGGTGLVGKSLVDCHPEAARAKLLELLKNGGKNIYTIEKNGVKKLIFQSEWKENGKLAGLVELSLEIPFDMPHFVRK